MIKYFVYSLAVGFSFAKAFFLSQITFFSIQDMKQNTFFLRRLILAFFDVGAQFCKIAFTQIPKIFN